MNFVCRSTSVTLSGNLFSIPIKQTTPTFQNYVNIVFSECIVLPMRAFWCLAGMFSNNPFSDS